MRLGAISKSMHWFDRGDVADLREVCKEISMCFLSICFATSLKGQYPPVCRCCCHGDHDLLTGLVVKMLVSPPPPLSLSLWLLTLTKYNFRKKTKKFHLLNIAFISTVL